MNYEKIQTVVSNAIKRSGRTIYALEQEYGFPRDSIRNAIDGHEPRAGRLSEICDALGLEFYIGPPGAKDVPTAQASHLSIVHDDVSDSAENEIADPTAEPQKIKCSGFQHVNDKRLADMIARLVDDWSAGGEFRRGQLYERFEDIKANTSPRRVAELIGWVIIEENGYQNGTEQ